MKFNFICGEGDPAYVQQLETRTKELSLNDSVEFVGRVDGAAKEEQFKKADLCIVPSFKENFCIVVAEALARGVPVIAGKGTPWSGIETNECGLWVDNDPQELAQAIDRASKMPLTAMGERGREWMEREYSWSTVARQMRNLYRSLIAEVTPAAETIKQNI